MKNTPIEEQSEVVQYPLLKKLADAYNKTNVAYFFRVVQPSGVFLAAIGLVFAAWTVKMSLDEMEESRKVREANLLVALMERLDVARTIDAGKSATKFDREKQELECTVGTKQLQGQAGQIVILERMSYLGLSLRDIDAHEVNLVVRRNRRSELPGINLAGAELIDADFRNSNLRDADLSGTKLHYAKFYGACMRKVSLAKADLKDANARSVDFQRADFTDSCLLRTDFRDAKLKNASFQRVDFSEANLKNADISGADFTRAKGLTQDQLDSACADEDNPPKNLPMDDNKEQLKWNQKQCK